ncbi:Hypothetical protein PHPALM_12547 [Phytophthora palmivora]|uniref:ZSWIM1/3 RNaseH-like domain-containing protein n=1 Tax=Phytophthora palmivora TaxID=4796 RepID=A0A2P4XZG9_9STRA|nr:Hypothetical protein PHPALM_12547 [Phytophthora palmivora]
MLHTVSDMHETESNAKGFLIIYAGGLVSGGYVTAEMQYLNHVTFWEKTALPDVHNVLQSIRCEKRGDTTDATPAKFVLCEFMEQNQGNSANIFVEEAFQAVHVVVFQSARMKRLFQPFPEVILDDTTHETNYVQHALVKVETKDKFRLAIKCFQSINQRLKNVKVFVTDKAFYESLFWQRCFSVLDICYVFSRICLEKRSSRMDPVLTRKRATPW